MIDRLCAQIFDSSFATYKIYKNNFFHKKAQHEDFLLPHSVKTTPNQ